MLQLRVSFHFIGLCPFNGMTGDEWVASIGTAWGTGLLTFQDNDPLFGGKSGTLYVNNAALTSSDFAGLRSSLITQWSHNCVVVDDIEDVSATGQPTPDQEQKKVDSDHPGFSGGLGDAAAAIFDDFKKFVADVFAIVKTAGIVVGVLLVLVAGIALIHYKPWEYV